VVERDFGFIRRAGFAGGNFLLRFLYGARINRNGVVSHHYVLNHAWASGSAKLLSVLNVHATDFRYASFMVSSSKLTADRAACQLRFSYSSTDCVDLTIRRLGVVSYGMVGYAEASAEQYPENGPFPLFFFSSGLVNRQQALHSQLLHNVLKAGCNRKFMMHQNNT
jgi:hypothetical protein